MDEFPYVIIIDCEYTKLLYFDQYFFNIIFSELLGSLTVFMTQEYVMHENAKRRKQDSFKNRPFKQYVSPWGTVKAKNYIRLTARVISILANFKISNAAQTP